MVLVKKALFRALDTVGLTAKVHPSLRFVVSAADLALTGVVAAVALGTAGVNVAPLVTGFGIGGAFMGLACREVGANFAAGVALFVAVPFNMGDRVTINKSTGDVVDWDMRQLTLSGRDGERILVPNAVVFNSVVTVHPAGAPWPTRGKDAKDDADEGIEKEGAKAKVAPAAGADGVLAAAAKAGPAAAVGRK
jgi:small-conductance mechanosensitive channel